MPARKHGTACRTCRRRGRKCDRSLPTCQSCRDRGVLCEGYVLRWAGVAARGRFAGKTIPLETPSGTVSNESGSTNGVESGLVQSNDRPAKPPLIHEIISGAGDGVDELIGYCETPLKAMSDHGGHHGTDTDSDSDRCP